MPDQSAIAVPAMDPSKAIQQRRLRTDIGAATPYRMNPLGGHVVRRRTVLALAAGAAAAGVSSAAGVSLVGGPKAALTRLPEPDHALAAGPAGPSGAAEPLVAQRQLAGGRLRVEQTAFVLSHLGLAWAGSSARIRTCHDGRWTAWQNLEACNPGRDGRPAGGNALLVVPGASAYDVWVADRGTGQILELNTVDSGPSAAAEVASSMPMPDGSSCVVPYLSRAAWGANESLRFKNGTEYWPPVHYRVQTFTVHHSASINNDPDPAATVRAVYHHQTINLDWGDIGYNLLIDEAGRVYQGRWSGGSLPVFQGSVGPGFPPLAVEGAHVLSFNPANVGICVLGNFTASAPTNAAKQSLVRVLASLASVTSLDPLGTTTYLNPVNGMSASVNVIGGHRDYAPTACPGDVFYPQLADVRQSVAPLVLPPAMPTQLPRRPEEPIGGATPAPSPPPRRR